MSIQSNIESYTIDQLRTLLYQFASKTGACEESIDRIRGIKSLKDFKEFLEDFNDSIDERLYLSEPIEINITPELIVQYVESPFVSEWDKQRVKEVLCKK